MLEAVDLTLKLPKLEFRDLMGGPEGLYNRLRRIQRRCQEGRVPVALVFEGWDASGKGTLISRILDRLDPRGFRVHPISAPLEEERLRPFLWRFWMKMPEYGQIALFDRSWYGRVMVERIDKLVDEHQVQDALREITEFERQLAADGMVICKFFLHISKKEQKRRFKECEKDPFLAWKIQPEDWRHHKQYDRYVVAIEEMLAQTSRSHAPWTIIESTCLRWAQVKTFRTICDLVEAELLKRGIPDPDLMPEETASAAPDAAALNPVPAAVPAEAKPAKAKAKAEQATDGEAPAADAKPAKAKDGATPRSRRTRKE